VKADPGDSKDQRLIGEGKERIREEMDQQCKENLKNELKILNHVKGNDALSRGKNKEGLNVS